MKNVRVPVCLQNILVTVAAVLLAFPTVAATQTLPDEVVLWHASSGTLFVGDVMLGRGPQGLELCPDSWLPDGVVAADLAASLAPLRDLPIRRILPGHGEPVLEDARERLISILDAAG